jgi:hypothetical protein
MASSSSSIRRSIRKASERVSFQSEQEYDALSREERRDLRRAIAISVAEEEEDSDAESDELSDDELVEEGEEEEEEEEEQEQKVDEFGWTNDITPVDAPMFFGGARPSRRASRCASPLEFLRLFLPRSLVLKLARWTTAYALREGEPATFSTTAEELYAFMGVQIYMGIVSLPRTSMYWSSLYCQSFVTSVFTRDRFELLLHYFRVVPPDPPPSPDDPLSHVRSFCDTLNRSFAQHYAPSQNIALDEAMVAFKGRSPIKQYMPKKPHKWGYKVWCLASDEYLLRFHVYEGPDPHPSPQGATHDVVMKLIRGFENQHHIFFFDSYFTSPALLNSLKVVGIWSCGSVQSKRKGLPVDSKSLKREVKQWEQGHYEQRQRMGMALTVWNDRKDVWILYNHCSPLEKSVLRRWTPAREAQDFECPRAVRDYFYEARSVDIINQLHYTYPIGRKSKRCWPRLMWWLIDMCILNAFKLWSIGQQRVRQLDFREQLMYELVAEVPADQRPQRQSRGSYPLHGLAKDHYPERAGEERRCVVCLNARRHRTESRFICNACGVHLCIGNCFSLYHTNLEL